MNGENNKHWEKKVCEPLGLAGRVSIEVTDFALHMTDLISGSTYGPRPCKVISGVLSTKQKTYGLVFKLENYVVFSFKLPFFILGV